MVGNSDVPQGHGSYVIPGYDPDRKVEEEPRLGDGSPLYYALLKDPDALFLKSSEAQQAKALLSTCMDRDPKVVLSCAGKTAAEAKKILNGLLLN